MAPNATSAAATASLPDRQPAAHVRGPDWILRLPAEIRILVFQHLARSCTTCSASLVDFLGHRLVCKRFDQLIRSKHVAFAALLAINGNLLWPRLGAPMVQVADLAGTWWRLLMDQRRLDRVWLDGAVTSGRAAVTVRPGYEVLMIDVEPKSADSKLSQYDWPCAAISVSSTSGQEEGVVAFLAHRVHCQSRSSNSRSDRGYRRNGVHSVAVHLIDYPLLRPIATHSLKHRGFGTPVTNCDLPVSAHLPSAISTEQSSPVSLQGGSWAVALGHVDGEHRRYSFLCTDSRNFSILHLRSYSGDGAMGSGAPTSTGTTVASVCLPSTCDVIKVCLISTQPTVVRVIYIHKTTRLLHILTLHRTSLVLVSETVLKHAKAYFYDYSPMYQPDLIALRPISGHAHICNIHTGQLVDTFQLPARLSITGQKAHGVVFRPLLRPLEGSTGFTMPHSYGQWMVEWVQGVRARGDEDHAWNSNKCHLQIVNPAAAVGQPARVVNTFVEPPVQSGTLLGAHLYLVFSPNGQVTVIDLRREGCSESDMAQVWNVGAKFAREFGLQAVPRVGQGDRNGSQEDGFDVVVRRVLPEDVGHIMRKDAQERLEVAQRRQQGRGVRAVRRHREREGAEQSQEYPDSDEGSDQGSNDGYPGESENDEEEEGEEEEDGGDEDIDDELWENAGEVVALGTRGDAVLVQRGSVIAILRRCIE